MLKHPIFPVLEWADISLSKWIKKKLKMDKGEENFEETVITLASIMISPLSVEV